MNNRHHCHFENDKCVVCNIILPPKHPFKRENIDPFDGIDCDEISYSFNVRKKDNRVRIVISQPSWAIKINKAYYYVSIEDLVNHKWVYRRNSVITISNPFIMAMETAKRLYTEESDSPISRF